MVLFRYKNDKNNTTLRKHQQPPTISPSISPPAVVQQKEGILSNVIQTYIIPLAFASLSTAEIPFLLIVLNVEVAIFNVIHLSSSGMKNFFVIRFG